MKAKTVFYCNECGYETPKWMGKCPGCGSWNTLVEQTVQPVKPASKAASAPRANNSATPIDKLDAAEEIRFSTGMSELDRVLGGGAVKGSLVLVGGAPGIGKSTLLLQICQELGKAARILYVTGEESQRQVKMRAQRLGVSGGDLYILAETNLAEILSSADTVKPDILIIDSIQTLYNEELSSAPGSVGQVKDCTMALMRLAKGENITVFVVGHVNKEGAIAGPKVLEHMVDCVLYFEGEQNMSYRVLRAAKNRFGSTNEIGVFEMLDVGLAGVSNPSEMLLSERPANSPGTCVACVIEGTRPVLAEVQALVTPTSFNVPRRTTNGVDFNRAMLLLAVLEKRGGMRVGSCDAYINVIGGLNLNEPGADLPTIIAIASSYRDRPVGDDIAAIGEVGLTGELRSVNSMNQRLSETARMGFKRCIIPAYVRGSLSIPPELEVFRAKTISDALKYALN